MRDTCIVLFACLLVAPQVARAAPCDRLSGGQLKIAHRLFQSVHLYDCCDELTLL